MSNQDVNINKSSAHELFPQQTDVSPTNDLNQHQFRSHQDGHTDICSLDELFPHCSAFSRDQPYDQHK